MKAKVAVAHVVVVSGRIKGSWACGEAGSGAVCWGIPAEVASAAEAGLSSPPAAESRGFLLDCNHAVDV